jgi:hypothetical protein
VGFGVSDVELPGSSTAVLVLVWWNWIVLKYNRGAGGSSVNIVTRLRAE